MREWVRKRHMTDFEMNVHRERAALAKNYILCKRQIRCVRNEQTRFAARVNGEGKYLPQKVLKVDRLCVG